MNLGESLKVVSDFYHSKYFCNCGYSDYVISGKLSNENDPVLYCKKCKEYMYNCLDFYNADFIDQFEVSQEV